MSRRTLGALLILTLAAGGAACSRVRPPATAPGLTASDSTTHPASSTEVVQGTPPAPAKQGNAGTPPDSSEPATEINPKGETLLPPLGFRPTLLLLLYKPGIRHSEEAYGYDLITRQLGQLTEGGPGGAGEIAPAPDGDLFAYFRSAGGGPGKNAGLCTRPIQGGPPTCLWTDVWSELQWRPATRDLYVGGESQLAGFRVDTKGFSPIARPPGLSYLGQFSPDGRWLTYKDKGLVVAPLEPGAQVLRFDQVTTGGGEWIARDKLLVEISDMESRLSQLATVGLDGKVTPFPLPTPGPTWIERVLADPGHRYVVANYGRQGGIYHHEDAAMYRLALGKWETVRVGHERVFAMGWVGQGRLLVENGDKYTLHDPETGRQTALPAQVHGHYFTSVSPDGDWLTFEPAKTPELWLYRVSTGELRAVDTKGMTVVRRAWVPQTKPR